jgi:hypothetical protein
VNRQFAHLAGVFAALATALVVAPAQAQARDDEGRILLDDRVLRQAQLINPQATGRESTKAVVEQYPLHGKFSLHDLVHLSVSQGLMDVRTAADLPTTNQPVRIEVEGSAATWAVYKRTVGQASAYLTVSLYDFSAAPDDYWHVGLNLRDNQYVMLVAQTGDRAAGVQVRLTQSQRKLRFTVTEARKNIVNASADSVDQLRRENAQLVRKYLEPPLRRITGRSLLKPGPADVYRVFEQIQPDPAVARQVARLLIRLDAESFKERESASDALAQLGGSAVLAVLRLDRSLVSAEVNTRLTSFLAAHGNSTVDPQQAATDRHFLVDCLDDEDAKVRSAAKEALEKLLSRTITFDLSLTGEQRLKAVDAVRREMELKSQQRDSKETR